MILSSIEHREGTLRGNWKASIIPKPKFGDGFDLKVCI
jgi:hypothetical protein